MNMELEFSSRPRRPGSLIWSEDNIAALVTPSTLHIFTPTLGGILDLSKVKFLKTAATPLSIENDSPPWKLKLNVANMRNAVSTGTIDFLAAAWSPTGCTQRKGCMLACITSRHSVFIYTSGISHMNRQWEKSIVLDKTIATHWKAGTEVDPDMADKLETASLAWSPKIFTNGIGSLLALGNKAGSITLWKVTDPNDIQCVSSWDIPSRNWVTRLSWSPWIIEGDHYTSILAFATAEGIVGARKVKFHSSSPLASIQVSEDLIDCSGQGLHPCLILRWQPRLIGAAETSCLLAFNRGNRLNVWDPETNKVLVWRRPIAKTISEISWDTTSNKLFIFFMDGKHCVLCVNEDDLTIDEDLVDFVNQSIISRCHVQTMTNIKQEDGDADIAADDAEDESSSGVGSKLQLHIISGDRSAEGMHIATVYCVTSPFQMEFQRERYESCTLVLSKVHRDTDEATKDLLLGRLMSQLTVSGICLQKNPASYLWDILVLLGDSFVKRQDGTLFQELVKSEYIELSKESKAKEAFSKAEAIRTTQTTLKERLEWAIFEKPEFGVDRFVVYVWNQFKDLPILESIKDQLQEAALAAEQKIQRHVLKSILQLFDEQQSLSGTGTRVLNEQDQLLLQLLSNSVLLFHKEDTDLVSLAEKVQRVIRSKRQGSGKTASESGQVQEICPACDAEIEHENDSKATCSNNHSWQRCSVTSLLISDFHPRTCLGCSRKSLQALEPEVPDSSSSEAIEPSWLDAVLRACSVCCYCGGRFFNVLWRKGK
ncbi:hypothetical protein BGW38_000760 [Lunasporangiospora selenospora]|uniref:Transcription factor IIIC 90kDa subunit N-terminal domain-containing protein n=1 Tax=Lunasporangiospora selenospora TaxID=979761 RepID=A0A9P6G2A0_9FUNG|nr:hypothetical protein BGW38_000760 [Lunasporangiospora selenospora]